MHIQNVSKDYSLVKTILKPKFKVLFAAIALAIVGVGIHLEKIRRLKQVDWIPIQAPFPMAKGTLVKASFTAQLNQNYEIEFAFRQDRVTPEEIERLIRTIDDPSPLDIEWEVRHKNNIVAKGNCHEYLYLNQTRFSPEPWIFKNVGFQSGSPENHQGNTVARGVGKFLGIQGETFELEARVGEPFVELANAHPTLQVRMDRRFTLRKLKTIRPMKRLSKVFLGLAIITSCWFFLTLFAYKFFRKNG